MANKAKGLWIAVGVVIIVILIILGVLFSTVWKPEQEEVIKIGAVLPLTGNIAYWGQPVLKGMKFAIEEINAAGGINGRRIELITEDSKADPSEGVTALNKILTSDPVSVIVHTTAVSNAVAPILEENKVPWIADAADTGLPLKYNYAFKTFYNAYAECKKLVSYGLNRGMVKFGLLLPNMPWGEWCAKGVKEIIEENNVIDLRYTFKETDFRTLLLKAKEKKVDGLIWIGFPFESNAINKQKAELGIVIPLLCGYGQECVSEDSLLNTPSKYLEGYIIFDFVISDKFKEKYGTQLSESEFIPAAFGYEEIHIIASALKECKEISKSCLYDKLPSVKNYSTALNSDGFDDMRNLIINTALYELKNKAFILVK